MTKKTLDDRTIKAAKPRDETYQKMESDGFGLRIEPSGKKSFILFKRYPGGSGNPVRRQLGTYPAMTLAQAHEKARLWRALIEKGIDPATETKRLQEAAIKAEKAKQARPTVAAALDIYVKRSLAKLRRGSTVAKELRRELKAWLDRPIADVSPDDVKGLVWAIVDRGRTPEQPNGYEAQAHQIHGYIRAFMNWAVEVGGYLDVSPCSKLAAPKRLIGKRKIGDRVLTDDELIAYVNAARAMSHPNGTFLELLALSGVRRTEAASMVWGELEDGAWTIPAGRMKSGSAHLVPLVPTLRAFFDGLPPRGKGGDYVFSNFAGMVPISAFSRIKLDLDERMKAELAAKGIAFRVFKLHDVRRSVRTRLSKLKVSGEVAEALISHAKPGLVGVYNLDDYREEKAEALELWHAKLKTLVEPEPEPVADNVVKLRA